MPFTTGVGSPIALAPFSVKTIKIWTNNGVNELSAIVLGPLAVHRSPDVTNATLYNITHLRTGLIVIGNITSEMRAKRIARAILEKGHCWNWGEFGKKDDKPAHFAEIALTIKNVKQIYRTYLQVSWM